MTNYNVELKPITVSDYVHFFKEHPKRTIRGYSFFLNGEMVAVFGAILEKEGTMLFSDMKDGIDVPKITIYRWSKKALELIDDMKQPLYATTLHAGKFLDRLGFCYRGNTKCGRLIYEYMR
jgi:hypothetical protein